MDRARSGSRHAYAHLTGELGMAAGHEGRHFLVAHLNEADPVIIAVERAHEAVDAIARISIDSSNTPGGEPFENVIADVHARCRRACRVPPSRARCTGGY